MIYIVEDDSAIRELEQYALQSNGYEAVGFESSEPFWQAVHTAPPALVILDVMLPGEDGFSILTKLRAAVSSPARPFCRWCGVLTSRWRAGPWICTSVPCAKSWATPESTSAQYGKWATS